MRRKAGFRKDQVLILADNGVEMPDDTSMAILSPITVVVPPQMGRVVSDQMHCFWSAIELMGSMDGDIFIFADDLVKWKKGYREQIISIVRKSPKHLVTLPFCVAMSRAVLEGMLPAAANALRGKVPTIGDMKAAGMEGIKHDTHGAH